MADGISHNWDEECKTKNIESTSSNTSTKTVVQSSTSDNQSLVMAVAGFALGFVAAYVLILFSGKKEHNKKE